MELSLLLQLYAWNCYTSLAIGLALNFLLIFVAKKCPSTGLREYRRVVFRFCLLNILFLIVQALNQPLCFSADKFMYILLNGPIVQIPSPSLWIISTIIFLLLLVHLLAGLAMQFVERYMVICRNHQKKLCRNLTVYGILGLFSLLSIMSVILDIPRGHLELANLNEPIFAATGNINVINNIKIICQADLENPIVKCVFIGLFGFMTFSYLATIFCYWRIRAFLKVNMQTEVVHGMKRKTLNNIICSMLIQTFVSIYSMALGAFMMGITMIAQADQIFGQFLLVFFALFNWLPVLNPLITILSIDDYRNGTVDIFKRQHTHHQTTPIMPFVKS